MKHFQPLPTYADPRLALARALPALSAGDDMSVTDAAEKYMRVSVGGSWESFDRNTTPYMIEPTDQLASRAYRALALCGPSQSGKTVMLQSAAVHSIMSAPGRVALFQMTEHKAKEFSSDKISPMIENSPDLKAALGRGRGSDNILEKKFQRGTRLTLDWPTPTTLASTSLQLALGTDYDHFPKSIGNEGDAFTMMRARVRSYMSRGMAAVESSPAAPVLDPAYVPQTIHDAPPVAYGVLSIYPMGTKARFYWTCPQCSDEFMTSMKLLDFPRNVDPVEAGRAARLICPCCGYPIEHAQKRALNRSGRWLHESADGTRAVPLGDPDIRRSEILTYWADGVIASFSTWSGLVADLVAAEQRLEKTGDEESLKTALNTGFAWPHIPAVLADDENPLTVAELRAQAVQGIAQGVAPSWTRYVTTSIDTQKNRFEVGVVAWGADGQHQLIDRFAIVAPPEGAPEADGRPIMPFDYAEDWAALDKLERRVYRVDGCDYGLRPVALLVDMQGGKAETGEGSATENAYAFFRRQRGAGLGNIWFLSRGHGGKQRARVWHVAPERVSSTARKGRAAAVDVKILNMATDRLKNAVFTSLKNTAGANVCLFGAWVSDRHLNEAVAERKSGEVWEKRPGYVRNETFDLLVQARAAHIQIGGERLNHAAPPDWARPDASNLRAVPLGAVSDQAAPEAPEEIEAVTPDPAPRRRRVYRSSYLSR